MKQDQSMMNTIGKVTNKIPEPFPDQLGKAKPLKKTVESLRAKGLSDKEIQYLMRLTPNDFINVDIGREDLIPTRWYREKVLCTVQIDSIVKKLQA